MEKLSKCIAPRYARTGVYFRPLFDVAQKPIKLGNTFQMHFDGTTQNFTAMARGGVIATDGDLVYRVAHDEELVVFPNPAARIGQRAGLMVVRGRLKG